MVSERTIIKRYLRAERRAANRAARAINRALRHRHERALYPYAKVVAHKASAAQRMSESYGGDRGSTHHPLGFRLAPYHARALAPNPRLTGINHKLKTRLAGTSYLERGSWKTSRSHKLSARIHIRKHKQSHVRGWRVSKGGVVRPVGGSKALGGRRY